LGSLAVTPISVYHDFRNRLLDIARGRLLFLLIPLLCLPFGCLSQTNLAHVSTGWATEPLSFYADEAQNSLSEGNPLRTEWKLSGAPGETLGESFLVRLDAPTTQAVSFNTSALVGPVASIGAANIHIFSVESVSVKSWPGWHIRSIPPSQRKPVVPDVLVPIDAPGAKLANGLEPNVDHYFWVDITLPRDVAPGAYYGEIELKDGQRTLSTMNLELTVWPFLLPNPSPITFVASVDHKSLISHHLRRQGRPLTLSGDDWSGAADAVRIDRLIQQTMVTLRNHGLNPVIEDFSPTLKITSSNEVLPDWRHYRSIISPALSGALFGDQGGLTRLPIPVKPLTALRSASSAPNPLHKTLARHYLQQCANEFKRLGALSKGYLLVDHQMASSPFELAALPYANWDLASDPTLPIIRHGVPQNLRPYGWADYTSPPRLGKADGWLIPGQFFDRATTLDLKNKGKKTWLQVDRPPFTGSLSIAAPPSYARVIAWQALSLDADTVFVGQACHWPAADRNDKPQACIEFDSRTLLYPGRPFGVDHPLVSMRLKYLRQGIQDIAYDELLRQHNLSHIARTVRQAIVGRVGTQAYRTHFADGRRIGWPTNWLNFDAAKEIYIEELSRTIATPQMRDHSSALARNVRWRKLMKDMRHLVVQCDGTRIRLTGETLSPELEIQSSLSISNRSRTAVSGSLQYDTLPMSWVPERDSVHLPRVLPTHSGRIKMSSLCPLSKIPFASDQRFSVSLTTDNGPSITTQTRTRLIAASRAKPAVVIDGELDDWQDNTTNVLRDFELISTTWDETLYSEEPKSRTLAFVKRDDEYLYIAVRGDLVDEKNDHRPRRNRIEYDDMIPTGSEVIEILIDPLNAGTRSPTDLFHIVVMKNGGDYAEKGVRFDPPCGRSTPWAVNIRTATSYAKDHWTCELAIPFSAFGPVATDHTIWGFNVTRFDATHQEFSTWSGAQLNAYDPQSLGNLLLP